MKQFTIAVALILVVIIAAGIWFWKNPPPSAPPASKDDLITVDAPLPNASVRSPLTISGKARGGWYFEASFPVKIYDGNGTLLGSTPAQAIGDWMTSEYVPFTATLTFTLPTTPTGTLVLEKDNPSGLPEHANELSIPVRFAVVADFSADGNVVRNNPGLKPDVWYLVYEEPGVPARTVELEFTEIATPALAQGQRVHVEGVARDSKVLVSSITSVQEEGMLIKLYYYNPTLDQGPGGVECSKKGLVAVERVIPTTQAPLKDSIQLLLRGELSEEEKSQGITTELPLPGVALQSARITNGTATLTFADPQNKTGGGSCRVAILWAQIEATAKQFPTVSSVRFQPEELFQP